MASKNKKIWRGFHGVPLGYLIVGLERVIFLVLENESGRVRDKRITFELEISTTGLTI